MLIQVCATPKVALSPPRMLRQAALLLPQHPDAPALLCASVGPCAAHQSLGSMVPTLFCQRGLQQRLGYLNSGGGKRKGVVGLLERGTTAQGSGCVGPCVWSKNRAIKSIACSDRHVNGRCLFQRKPPVKLHGQMHKTLPGSMGIRPFLPVVSLGQPIPDRCVFFPRRRSLNCQECALTDAAQVPSSRALSFA